MQVLFFGTYKQKVGTDRVEMNAADLDKLKEQVHTQFPFVNQAKCAISVNQKIAIGNMPLSETDEIAFMPPFSGG